MLFLNDSGTFQSDITRFSLRVRIVFQDKIQYFLFNVKPYFTNPYWHLYSRNLRRDSYLPYLPWQLYLLTKTASTIHKHTQTHARTHTHTHARTHTHIYIYIYIYCISINMFTEFSSWIRLFVNFYRYVRAATDWDKCSENDDLRNASWIRDLIAPPSRSYIRQPCFLRNKRRNFFLPISLSHFGQQILS